MKNTLLDLNTEFRHTDPKQLAVFGLLCIWWCVVLRTEFTDSDWTVQAVTRHTNNVFNLGHSKKKKCVYWYENEYVFNLI